MSLNVEIEIRIPYAHTDLMSTVYYSHYLEYFERARVELLRDIGFAHKKLEETGIHMAVTEAYCKYIRSLAYDDVIIIKPKIKEVGRASVLIEYEIINKDSKTLMATGFTKLAFVSSALKACAGPRDMVERMRQEI